MVNVFRAPKKKLTKDLYLSRGMTYEDAVMYYNPQWIERKALRYLSKNHRNLMSIDGFLDELYGIFKDKII